MTVHDQQLCFISNMLSTCQYQCSIPASFTAQQDAAVLD